ncbi:MAG: hypothetical protein JJU05_09815 [Verrucomicrobia bacterium]|nr:hypothetical protein [Verrucomicrobiota bacterium]MCH8527555.1 hypothetical protein [Kiritimatiellia bacterium]
MPPPTTSFFLFSLLLSGVSPGNLSVSRVDGPPANDQVVISQTRRDETGPTSFRFYAPRSGAPTKSDVLAYDPDPSRSDEEIKAVAEARYYFRDRDLGQTFTTGDEGFRLQAITVRLQPVDVAGADPANAKVSVQFFKVTGSPEINDNGTAAGLYPGTNRHHNPRWDTYAFKWPHDPDDRNTPDRRPFKHYSDDFIEGLHFEHLHHATGGVVPAGLTTNDYMRWEFTGENQINFEPNTRYAMLFMFDEPAKPGVNRNIPLSNINVLPGGTLTMPMPGEHMIRRDGASTVFEEVFITDLNDPEDVAASQAAASFPENLAERLAIQPGTLGYPDVDTYRTLYFYIERVPPPSDTRP